MPNITIWKYQLRVKDTQFVMMPAHADILCVQNQNGVPCLWVLCDPEQEKVPRTIDIIGTGHDVNSFFRHTYIGTVQQADGALVWHVFERHT